MILRLGAIPQFVTISALIASSHIGEIIYRLNGAMDSRRTPKQVGETAMQIAFYAGWPNAFSALPVVKDVFKKRAHEPLLDLTEQIQGTKFLAWFVLQSVGRAPTSRLLLFEDTQFNQLVDVSEGCA